MTKYDAYQFDVKINVKYEIVSATVRKFIPGVMGITWANSFTLQAQCDVLIFMNEFNEFSRYILEKEEPRDAKIHSVHGICYGKRAIAIRVNKTMDDTESFIKYFKSQNPAFANPEVHEFVIGKCDRFQWGEYPAEEEETKTNSS